MANTDDISFASSIIKFPQQTILRIINSMQAGLLSIDQLVLPVLVNLSDAELPHQKIKLAKNDCKPIQDLLVGF